MDEQTETGQPPAVKQNYWFLPKIDLRSERRCFGDPKDPRGHFWITLRALSIPEASVSGAKAQELQNLYCGVDPKTNERRFLLSPHGERVIMDEQFVASLAMIVDMQDEAPEEERIEFEQLVALSLRMPQAFQDMLVWSGVKEQESGLGKPSAAPEEPSHAQGSPPDSYTSNGCSSSPPASGRSMIDSEAAKV